jgi:hypothetical protein
MKQSISTRIHEEIHMHIKTALMSARAVFDAAAVASLILGATPVLAGPPTLDPHIIKWVSFDVLDSTGTNPSANNDLGEVTGWYSDANFIAHGFLRKADGAIVTFDPPGVGTGGTTPTGINNRGDIVGYYVDAAGGTHGFLRSANGTFTRIDDPNSNSSPVSTQAFAISDTGAIVGDYSDTVTSHGFLREPDGYFMTIDGPGGGGEDSCLDINLGGEVACNPTFIQSGFEISRGQLRFPGGNTATYNAPGALTQGPGTYVGCNCGYYQSVINIWGDVTGNYIDANGAVHGYVRRADGSFTEFLVPGTGTISGSGTIPNSINWLGTVVGTSDSVPYTFGPAFVRFANGTFILFTAPVSGQQGTAPVSINAFNALTGYWIDANFSSHGFVALGVPW